MHASSVSWDSLWWGLPVPTHAPRNRLLQPTSSTQQPTKSSWQSLSHHMLPPVKTHQWLFISNQLNVHILPQSTGVTVLQANFCAPSSFHPQVHSHPNVLLSLCLDSHVTPFTLKNQPKSPPLRGSPWYHSIYMGLPSQPLFISLLA